MAASTVWRICIWLALSAGPAGASEMWITNEKDHTVSVIDTKTQELKASYNLACGHAESFLQKTFRNFMCALRMMTESMCWILRPAWLSAVCPAARTLNNSRCIRTIAISTLPTKKTLWPQCWMYLRRSIGRDQCGNRTGRYGCFARRQNCNSNL